MCAPVSARLPAAGATGGRWRRRAPLWTVARRRRRAPLLQVRSRFSINHRYLQSYRYLRPSRSQLRARHAVNNDTYDLRAVRRVATAANRGRSGRRRARGKDSRQRRRSIISSATARRPPPRVPASLQRLGRSPRRTRRSPSDGHYSRHCPRSVDVLRAAGPERAGVPERPTCLRIRPVRAVWRLGVRPRVGRLSVPIPPAAAPIVAMGLGGVPMLRHCGPSRHQVEGGQASHAMARGAQCAAACSGEEAGRREGEERGGRGWRVSGGYP